MKDKKKYTLKELEKSDPKLAEIIYACKDLVSDYVCFITIFIKTEKSKYKQLIQVDEDFDLYEELFEVSLLNILDEGTVTTNFDSKLINAVSDGIKNIMADHKTTELFMKYKTASKTYSLQIFDRLIENAKRGKK